MYKRRDWVFTHNPDGKDSSDSDDDSDRESAFPSSVDTRIVSIHFWLCAVCGLAAAGTRWPSQCGAMRSRCAHSGEPLLGKRERSLGREAQHRTGKQGAAERRGACSRQPLCCQCAPNIQTRQLTTADSVSRPAGEILQADVPLASVSLHRNGSCEVAIHSVEKRTCLTSCPKA